MELKEVFVSRSNLAPQLFVSATAWLESSYVYNTAHNPATLHDLLKFTGMGRGVRDCLPDEWVIELGNFLEFRGQAPPANNAKKFTTAVGKSLHHLPPHTLKLFSAPVGRKEGEAVSIEDVGSAHGLPLPVRTLLRGARMGLPTGQDIARTLSIENPISRTEIADSLPEEVSEYGFDEETPLWYYVLREAELRGNGDKLGPVGSRIVAEVIFAALWADPNSYLSIDPQWQPPPNLLDDVLAWAAVAPNTTAT